MPAQWLERRVRKERAGRREPRFAPAARPGERANHARQSPNAGLLDDFEMGFPLTEELVAYFPVEFFVVSSMTPARTIALDRGGGSEDEINAKLV